MAGKRATRTRPEMILDAAKELFYERSFAAVGVDEIGARAGVTGPAIYRHFRGKDEILSTLFDDALDRLWEATSVRCDEPWEELDGLVRGHALFVLSERELAGVRFREERCLSRPYRRELHRREREYVERWTGCLARCYPDADAGELTAAAHIALGALNSVATWSPEAARAEHVPEMIIAMVLRALSALDSVPASA